MATTVFSAKGLTGGGADDLDFIDGDDTADGDFAIVEDGETYYLYHLDDDLAAAENSPYIIVPDANAGTKCWVLVQEAGRLISEPASDHTVGGLRAKMTAGENVIFGNVCYLKSDGKLWKSDADAQSTMPVFAMALGTIAADADGDFLLKGFVRDDTWNWTVGGKIYASATVGEVTQTEPVSGDQTQCVGVATHADRIWFEPNYTESEMCKIKTGSYTGDGTVSQAITGVGFRPKYLAIWEHVAASGTDYDKVEKLDQTWGDNAFFHRVSDADNTHYAFSDRINSLDADGFTVDDGAADEVPNKNGATYDYMAMG